ncbi:bifunctional SDR family oxidoreductase/aminotransferase class I/II-fold pyridoxal phosphate-dependent enzyme [Nocardia asiatica]|uniref:bifunctional SDR family oxidoreductase/aminotransferase class I/II-fold pyridoxal phosphate-dependent enzyme n=1 Tax=Nocardia asiatica TaxID=209252 RepID=UPI0002F1210B|nr:bifunctional SDR family oxidoreductase/aminotransferase class I/II-fold pyridoxal phosphate-dependent enzyme [Nocardia asiatica]
MHNVLVTGAGGYLGALLVPALLEQGQSVTAIDTFYFGDVLASHEDHPKLRIHRMDVRKLDSHLLTDIDTVISLAAISDDRAGSLKPLWTTHVNETAPARLAALARDAGARRFIHASTCDVYSASDQLLNETSKAAPRSEYSISKLLAERTTRTAETPDFRTISLRLGTLCGVSPRMRLDLTVHAMTYAALTEGQIVVDGDGAQWRPLLHVRDAVRAFLACVELPDENLSHHVYNVVGENLRVRDLAQLVSEAFDGATMRMRGMPDRRSCRVSGELFAAGTGFSPDHTVEEAINEVRGYLQRPGQLDAAEEPRFWTAVLIERVLNTPAISGGEPVRDEELPFTQALLGKAEEDEVLDTLRSGSLTTGPKTERFEHMCADYLGVAHAIATNSCTGALHIGLAAAGIGPGDEVITTPITAPATVNAIIHLGATPIFADIDAATLNIDPEAVRAAITPKTSAILPVHLAGQPCDMDAIRAIADEHELLVVEDAAHAIGAEYRGRRIGQLSEMTAYSFGATANLFCGDGGLLATNNQALAERARSLSMHGLTRGAGRRHPAKGVIRCELLEPGYKCNMPDLAASLGLHQLPRLDSFIDTRARYASIYDEHFAALAAITPLTRLTRVRHAHNLYVIVLNLDRLTVDRDAFAAALKAEGIGTEIHFRSLHLQPYYRQVRGFDPNKFPIARDISERILTLPLYPKLTETDVDNVAAAVTKLATAYHR